MTYKKSDLVKLALKELKADNDILFVRDLVAVLPCSRATFYNKNLDKLDTIADALDNNRINLCRELRGNWRKSENPTLQTNLYKLISSDEEAHRLNGSKQEIDTNIRGSLDVNIDKQIDQVYGDDEKKK